ncbi:O-antigen ligase family protein [Enterococcus casseliflavus]|uniref:O-antigen ligase family protein n=1 Tax=Enterococcus casseliflavus TaxID=37734 RepID=UPI003D151403
MILRKNTCIYYLAFFLLLGNAMLGRLAQHIFFSNFISSISLVFYIILLLIVTAKKKMNLKVSFFVIYFSFLFLFFILYRNHNLQGSGITNIVFLLTILISIYLLYDSIEWIPPFLNVLNILCSLHVFITVITFFIPSVGYNIVNWNLSGDELIVAISQIENGKIVGLSDTYSLNATYISLAFGLSITNVLYYGENSFKNYKFIYFIFSFIALIVVGKRAHVILSLITIIFIWLIENRKKIKKRFFNLALLFILLVPIIVFLLPYVSNSLVFIDRFFDQQDLSTLGGRTELYAEAFRIFKDHVFIGVGWAGYPEIVQYTVGANYINGFSRMQAHNIYLQLLAEVGIIGFIFFAYLFYSGIRAGISEMRVLNERSKYKFFVVYSLYIQIFFVLYGLSGNPLYDRATYIPYFISLTIIYAIRFNNRNGKNNEKIF